ncbi:MAG: hypothetical protein J0M13_06120 [Candidatus Accumulibacter sp.]|nr:hypothetical protein [Candidatus Accumulibacter necessarius]
MRALLGLSCGINLDYAGLSGTLPYFRNTSATQGEAMATGKTAILSLRIEPGLKEALRVAAEHEHRSIANMVEVMIREYCGRNSVALAEQPAPVYSKQSSATDETQSPRTKKDA